MQVRGCVVFLLVEHCNDGLEYIPECISQFFKKIIPHRGVFVVNKIKHPIAIHSAVQIGIFAENIGYTFIELIHHSFSLFRIFADINQSRNFVHQVVEKCNELAKHNIDIHIINSFLYQDVPQRTSFIALTNKVLPKIMLKRFTKMRKK